MDSKVFGQFIAQIRKEKHMTQADLAEKIGVTDKAISRWERGIGFPDINTLEPLSNALDISILELMRSEKSDMKNRSRNLSENEVTELMTNAVEMTRENQRQDKVSVYLGAIATTVTAVFVYLSGRGNIGASLAVGFIAAIAVVGMYLFVRNKEDRESRKIYSFFMLFGIGVSMTLFHLMGIDPLVLAWGLYGVFCLVIGWGNRPPQGGSTKNAK